jgi:hypothetical protein
VFDKESEKICIQGEIRAKTRASMPTQFTEKIEKNSRHGKVEKREQNAEGRKQSFSRVLPCFCEKIPG